MSGMGTMVSRVKRAVKRYFPVANLWFFNEVARQKAVEAQSRAANAALAVGQKSVSAKIDAAAKGVAALDARAASLEKRLTDATVRVCNVRGVLERMEDRQGYLVELLERAQDVPRLDAIEVYFIEVTYKREFSFGSWPTRLHGCVSVRCGEHRGWGEMCIPLGKATNAEAVAAVARALAPWRGKSLGEAEYLVRARRGRTHDRILEALDMALLDVSARRRGLSVLEALGLKRDRAVPGLSCVLQKDIAAAQEAARRLARTHLKIKLFGDNVHDYNLVRAVRAVIPPDCFLVGDVNMGYAPGKEAQPYSADIVRALANLGEAGLSACEDPANLSWDDLARLQEALPGMPIIPDEPMRPAYRVVETVRPVPGHIYNLHPNCMGSVREAVNLAQKLTAAGAGVMIGDSSLIGPACAAWQQLACGLGAAWCEALEKPEESTAFTDCILSTPMETLPDGRRRIARLAPGFGLEVDIPRLEANCIDIVRL